MVAARAPHLKAGGKLGGVEVQPKDRVDPPQQDARYADAPVGGEPQRARRRAPVRPHKADDRLEEAHDQDGESELAVREPQAARSGDAEGDDEAHEGREDGKHLQVLVHGEPEVPVLPGVAHHGGEEGRRAGEGGGGRVGVQRAAVGELVGHVVSWHVGEEDAGDDDGGRHEDAEGDGEEEAVPEEVDVEVGGGDRGLARREVDGGSTPGGREGRTGENKIGKGLGKEREGRGKFRFGGETPGWERR